MKFKILLLIALGFISFQSLAGDSLQTWCNNDGNNSQYLDNQTISNIAAVAVRKGRFDYDTSELIQLSGGYHYYIGNSDTQVLNFAKMAYFTGMKVAVCILPSSGGQGYVTAIGSPNDTSVSVKLTHAKPSVHKK